MRVDGGESARCGVKIAREDDKSPQSTRKESCLKDRVNHTVKEVTLMLRFSKEKIYRHFREISGSVQSILWYHEVGHVRL